MIRFSVGVLVGRLQKSNAIRRQTLGKVVAEQVPITVRELDGEMNFIEHTLPHSRSACNHL